MSDDDGHVGLRQLYVQQIAERGFREDAAQRAAVEQLNDLQRRLIAAEARDAAAHRGARRLLARFARKPAVREPERGLYLWGGVGRGKTWLMDLFYSSLPFEHKRRRHFHRFMHDVHVELQGLSHRASPLEIIADNIAADTRVLCFDELFVSDIADAMILGGLFEGLFRRGVTLVATSNVPPHGLYKDGLQRQRFVPAIKLIEEHTRVLGVDGGVDYRLRQLTAAGTYLLLDASATPDQLDDLFTDMADGNNQEGGAISIEGRMIPIVRQGGTAVWFEFAALCDGPRSQNDYIEIAREYQTVLVANVPVMDDMRNDAARRFVALVDELYDRNVTLVLSAAAPALDLYKGTRLAFEFQRTVSRLTEMQSEEYLARGHRP